MRRPLEKLKHLSTGYNKDILANRLDPSRRSPERAVYQHINSIAVRMAAL